MERQDNSSMSNNERKWKSIKILGAEYIISNSATENSWTILLSNLVEIWTETITKDIALARCQSLNLLLDLDSFDIKGTLDAMLNDIPKHATDKSIDEIKLETSIDGIAFKFSINLIEGNPQQFWKYITKPLCQSSMELQRRHEIMLDLIKKKDEELLEYKLSGAQLIRKNIETLPYHKDIFGNEVTIRNLESEDCVPIFQSMVNLYNELKNRESSLKNVCKRFPQRSSDPNPVEPLREPKRENVEASEMTSVVDVNTGNELQSMSKIETKNENESIAAEIGITEQYGGGQTSPSVSKCKMGLQTEKLPKKESTMKNAADMPLNSIEQPSKRLKKHKIKPNIYDFIH